MYLCLFQAGLQMYDLMLCPHAYRAPWILRPGCTCCLRSCLLSRTSWSRQERVI